eukprot:m.18952 g.18952  ORF g.18952 m.18952 type:complete len:391 (+) comp27759_c0_seq4:132-1304(+)
MVSLVPFLSALLLLNNLDLPVAQQGGHLEITLVSYYDIDRRLPPGTTGNRKCCSPPSDEAEKLDVCDSSCNNEIVPCHPQYNPGGPNCPGEALPLPSFHTQPDEPDEDGVSDVQSYYFANSNIEFPFSGDWKANFLVVFNVYQYQETGNKPRLATFEWKRSDGLTLTSRYANRVLSYGTLESDVPSTRWLALRLRVVCPEYYYGNVCNIYCKPQDSPEGHYSCEPDGSKKCLDGYTDPETDCVTMIMYCESQPCQFNGICTNILNGFTCSCAVGYTGIFCETMIPACHSSPCQYGGTCTPMIDDYMCECRTQTTGKNCQTIIDPCQLLPKCQQYSYCRVNPGNPFDRQCFCWEGYHEKDGECKKNKSGRYLSSVSAVAFTSLLLLLSRFL